MSGLLDGLMMILNNTACSNYAVFEFDNGRIVNLEEYPPTPIIWILTIIDLFCTNNFNWRTTIFNGTGWFHEQYIVPSAATAMPKLLSFTRFCQQKQQQQQLLDTTVNFCKAEPVQAMYGYAFKTSSTELGSLSTPTAIIVLMTLVSILRRVKGFLLPKFCTIGRKVALQTHSKDWIQENEIRIIKFSEYSFRLVYHTLISMYGIHYFINKEWWESGRTILVFQGHPFHEIESEMAWYYLIQSAYNIDAFITLIKLSFLYEFRSIIKTPAIGQEKKWQSPIIITQSPTIRGDFKEMLIHHMATNILVVGSSILRWTRIGSMVFIVNDVSEIPVDICKLLNFLQWKYTTVISFIFMTIIWFYTRLYILPMKIYYTVIYESHYMLQEGLSPLIYICYRHFFYFFLGLLIVLNFVWFAMILRMLHTFIMKRECHDYSEHKNGESDVNDKKIIVTKVQTSNCIVKKRQ